MRIALVALVGSLWLAGSAAISAETDPYMCATSDAETALIQTTRGRVREFPSTDRFADIESRFPIVGCGIWSLTVSPSGAVESARIVRQEVRGNYEAVVRPWITFVAFKPSKDRWTGLMKVKLAEPSET